MPPESITITDKLTEKCYICGIAIYPQEIALELNGMIVDYIDHALSNGNITLCSECREKIKQNTAEDQSAAVLRRAALDRQLKQGDGT